MKVANFHPASNARKTSTKASVEIVIYERPAGETELGGKGNISAEAAARNGETPPRPAIYSAHVNALFPYPDDLDAARDRPENRNEPHVLPNMTLANIVTEMTPAPRDPHAPVEDHPVMIWHDTLSGHEGVGAISLVAHKLKISEREASYRLARFASMKRNIPFDNLIAPKVA